MEYQWIDEESDRMGNVKHGLILAVAATLTMLASGSAWAQGNRGGDLLANPQVQRDLELLDDQIAAIEAANGRIREKMLKSYEELRKLPRQQAQEKMASLRQDMLTLREKELSKVLLPHQTRRLKQIEFQSRMTRGGGGRAFESPEMMQQLALSDEQLEQIRKVAAETQAEIDEKLKALRRQAQEKILALLTPQQRRDFDELFGQPIEFSNPQIGGQGGRGDQPVRPQAQQSTSRRVET